MEEMWGRRNHCDMCFSMGHHQLASLICQRAVQLLSCKCVVPLKIIFMKDHVVKDRLNHFYIVKWVSNAWIVTIYYSRLQRFNNEAFRQACCSIKIHAHKNCPWLSPALFYSFTVPSDQLQHSITKQISAHHEPADTFLNDKWSLYGTLLHYAGYSYGFNYVNHSQ